MSAIAGRENIWTTGRHTSQHERFENQIKEITRHVSRSKKMQIDFHAKGFFYGDVAKDYALHRLGFALGRFEDMIRRVDVKVEEFQSRNSSATKRCSLQIYLERTPAPISTSVEDATLKAAIDIAAETVSHSVARRVNRMKSNSRARRAERRLAHA